MGWVWLGQLADGLGWVGSGHTKWTHGQLWSPHCVIRKLGYLQLSWRYFRRSTLDRRQVYHIERPLLHYGRHARHTAGLSAPDNNGSHLWHTTQWREDWSSVSLVNHTIVTDPTIRQPGFDLPRRIWFLTNRFRTGQGQCRANLHKWGLAQSPSCDCGQRQTMNHIAAHYQNSKVDWIYSTKWIMMQSCGWNLQRLQHLRNK